MASNKLPITINTLNLPNLVLVLSIIAPQIGSVIPSNIRIVVIIVEIVTVTAALTAALAKPIKKFPDKY